MRKNKLLLLLVLLVAVATGAYATEFTSLKVGDVIHVGDVINTGIDYKVYGGALDASFQPATLVRGNIGTHDVTESETGAYYLFKIKIDVYPGVIFGNEGYDGGYWPVTDTSDGITVTALTPGDHGYTELTFAVHEGPAPTGYSITLDEGTGNKDSQNWEITPKSSELSGSEAVTVKYNGSREVKSVTVVKKAEKAVDNTYLTWDGTQKKLVAAKIPAEVTTVTSENTEWSAGTYVVEGKVNITSMIELKGDVDLIIKDGAKLTVNGQIDGSSQKLRIYGQAQKTGELVVDYSDNDAIKNINTLEVHSAKVTATSYRQECGGIYGISTFNVYGGLVDAKATGAYGYGISLNANGKMNIYGGEVKAEGKGNNDNYSYGIRCSNSNHIATVTVHGGKLWAGDADKKAFNYVNLQKGDGFSGKIETSDNGSFWDEYDEAGTLDTKYVRVGY